jgi:hypothetical protein
MKKILLWVFGLFLFNFCLGQSVFQKTYGTTGDERGNDIFVTSDNGYIITGKIDSAAYLIRTDSVGDTLWTRIFDEPTYLDIEGFNVFETNSGSFIVSGRYDSNKEFLIKVTNQGNIVWTKYLTMPFNYSPPKTVSCFDGGILHASPGYITKTDSNGTVLWSKMVPASTTQSGWSIKQTADSGFVYSGSIDMGDPYSYLAKFSRSGNLLWTYILGWLDDVYDVQQTADGGFIAAGFSYLLYSRVLNKLDSTGIQQWENYYDPADEDLSGSVIQTNDGGYLLTGTTYSNGGVFLIKTNPVGSVVWAKSYGGVNLEAGMKVEATNDGQCVIVGSTASFGEGNNDIYLIKPDPLGWTECNIYNFLVYSGDWTLGNWPINLSVNSATASSSNWTPIVRRGTIINNYCTPPCTFGASLSYTPVRCHGDTTSGTIIPAGGTAPFTYSWNTGDTTANLNGVPAGNYTCSITDSVGCSVTQVVTIYQPGVLTSSGQVINNDSCYGGNIGRARAVVSGGTYPYTYFWIPSVSTSATASNLAAGCYTVSVTDNHGCTTGSTVCITQPPLLSANALVMNNVNCNGGSNGRARVTAGGGTGSYTYSWIPSVSTTATASLLTAGCYTVIVKDANGCSATDTVCITEPTALTVTASVLQNVSCNGMNDGVAAANANGGIAPYSYLWIPSSQTSQTCSNLIATCYTVRVTDANGCTATDTVCITEPIAIAADVCGLNPVNCSGDSSCMYACPVGGAPPYNYMWLPNGGSDDFFCTTAAGMYTLVITDINGCTGSSTITITQPAPLTATLTTTDASCSTCGDGFSIVNPFGGTGLYSYSWSTTPSQYGQTATNLLPGVYTCCVTDANGCSVCVSDTVSFPSSVINISNNENSISVIPNPFYNQIIIKNNSPCEIRLCDYTGKEILHQIINSGEGILNTEGLAVGLYFLGVDNGVGERNFKVVKQ